MSDKGIYQLKNIRNNKIYVGSSNSIKNRFIKHCQQLNGGYHGNPHLQSAWKKYGQKSFILEVLELVPNCFTEEQLLNREQFYIDKTKCLNPDFGYNIQPKAGKIIMTPKIRLKISKKLKGKYVNEKNPMYGKHHTLETKKKLSLIHTGKNYHLPEYSQIVSKRFYGKNNHNAIRISQYTLKGEYVKTYDCVADVIRFYNWNRNRGASIVACIHGRQKTAFGFKWETENVK